MPTRMLLIALLLCLFSTTVAQGGPSFDPPAWMEVSEVSGDMALSGLPTGVLHLASSRPAAAVLEHFRALWTCGSGEQRCRQAEMPPWKVLSRLAGKKLEFIQVRDLGSGASGYLALSEIGRRQMPQPTLPMMQGSQVVNSVVTRDPGKRGQVMLLNNSYSVTSNTTFYQDYFVNQGWRQVTEDQRVGSQVLVFHKGAEEAHLVISRQQGATQIVINLVQ